MAGINPKAILRNAAVVGSNTLPPQAGIQPQGTISASGIPIFGPGELGHVATLGILPFKKLLGQAAEDVAAKEAPKVPEFAVKIHPRAIPRAQDVKTLGASVTESLASARGLRFQQEALRSAERAKRSEAFGKALQADPTAAGAKAAKAELAGKYPELHFGAFDHFTPEAHDAMVKFITDHPNLKPFEPVRATTALEKIRAGTVPQRSEEKLLRSIFGHDVTKELMTSVSKFRQLKALGYDVGNIPRSVMASFDASGLLRQALLIATSHPALWSKNVPDYFKAIRSEEFANKALADLHARPNAVNGYYNKIGLDLTEMAPRGQAASREESFRSPLAEKIPGIRASGRGFTIGLDKNRADLADLLQAKAARMDGKLVSRIRIVDGKPRVVRERFDQHAQSLLDSIGTVVNSASGRGDLGQGVVGRSQEGLNLLLFSPRLIKSRVDFINPYWYAKLDPVARHEAYRAMAGLVGLVATADAIAREAGAQVNLDPRSSDFGKIKVGNTRIDLGGGFFQYMRLLSQLATNQVVSTTGKVTNIGQAGPGKTSDWDVVFRFVRSKLSPITSAGVDVSQRQNSVGQPLTWQNSVLSRFTPLSGQDAVSVGSDAAHSTGSVPLGALAGFGAFGLSAIGGGVQNFTPKAPKFKGSVDPFHVSGKSGGGGSDPFNVSRP